MSIYGNKYSNFNSNEIPEINYGALLELTKIGITFENTKNLSDDILTEGIIDKIKHYITNIKELKNQWKKVSDKFVKHEWIFRYITPKQETMLLKYYKMLTDDETSYGQYKRAFKFICRFMGLPSDKVIIENLQIVHDKKDPEKNRVAVKYSKGLARVNIPDDVILTHVSPAHNIKELIPTFRSKVKGKYMYPDKRIFFTVHGQIKKSQAGLEGQKLTKYKTKKNYSVAYIDPTYSDYKSGAVYISTDQPIPVEKC